MTDQDGRRLHLALEGREIWGDHFASAEIAAWFDDEAEAYAQLGAAEHGTSENYSYHTLNIRHGWNRLPSGHIGRALGLGSSYGGEFLPAIARCDEITILEPSAALRSQTLRGVPLKYVTPNASGDIPFPDATFDLVVSLGTLHHIPNVSYVVSEIGRVTRPRGHALVREPITSMGDWRSPRAGLTKRERGVPRSALRAAFESAGLNVVRETRCMFPTTRRLGNYGLGFNSALGIAIDRALSVAFSWNDRYHATTWWHKLHPTASFFVLQKE